MTLKFKLWENYYKLHQDYIEHAPPPNKTITGLEFFSERSTIDSKPKYLSGQAIFQWGADKIKDLIQQEIDTFSKSCKNLVVVQFQDDFKVLISHFDFDNEKAKLFNHSVENFPSIGDDFLKDAKALIKKYEPEIEHNKSWIPFLKNIALLLTGLGTLPALISIGARIVTGRYSFFDNKTISLEKLAEKLPSQSPNAQLL